MITVEDLARKLVAYARQSPEHAKREVYLAYDGEIAFQLGKGDDHLAFGSRGIESYFVLSPDLKGNRLIIKEKEIDGNPRARS